MKRAVTLALVTVALVTLGGCRARDDRASTSSEMRYDAGWHYRWVQGGPRAYYGFSKRPEMGFVAICDSLPVFALFGGDYSDRAARGEITTDGKSQSFQVFRSVHGGGLVFMQDGADEQIYRDAQALADNLASARSPIVISTDDGWRQLVPTDAKLARFVRECRSYRNRVAPAEAKYGNRR